MTSRRKPFIVGLDAYQLTRRELQRLGDTAVKIEVRIRNSPDVDPGPARFRKLLAKSPRERRAMVHEWRVRQHKKLCAELSGRDFEVLYFNGDPIGVRVQLGAKEVGRIAALAYVECTTILGIKGMRRKRIAVGRDPRWFAVQARFAIQYESQTKGLQTYEDRIVLVLARSGKEAEKKAMREFREYEAPSLTTTGHFCRWGFERILDVYDLYGDTIDPDGTEVYSELKSRRMKPEYEWHPAND